MSLTFPQAARKCHRETESALRDSGQTCPLVLGKVLTESIGVDRRGRTLFSASRKRCKSKGQNLRPEYCVSWRGVTVLGADWVMFFSSLFSLANGLGQNRFRNFL